MFFKVSESPERYVNTDNLELISFGTNRGGTRRSCLLDFRSGRSIEVSESAGRLLMEFQDSNTSLLQDDITGASATPDTPLLTTRIAQFLRDSAPNGTMLMDLVMKFETPGKVVEGELAAALDTLQAERVVVFIDSPAPGRFYHVTNAPRPAPPEASVEPVQIELGG